MKNPIVQKAASNKAKAVKEDKTPQVNKHRQIYRTINTFHVSSVSGASQMYQTAVKGSALEAAIDFALGSKSQGERYWVEPYLECRKVVGFVAQPYVGNTCYIFLK